MDLKMKLKLKPRHKRHVAVPKKKIRARTPSALSTDRGFTPSLSRDSRPPARTADRQLLLSVMMLKIVTRRAAAGSVL